MKLHVFANKLKANTYYEHLIHSDIWIFFDNRPMSNLVYINLLKIWALIGGNLKKTVFL